MDALTLRLEALTFRPPLPSRCSRPARERLPRSFRDDAEQPLPASPALSSRTVDAIRPVAARTRVFKMSGRRGHNPRRRCQPSRTRCPSHRRPLSYLLTCPSQAAEKDQNPFHDRRVSADPSPSPERLPSAGPFAARPSLALGTSLSRPPLVARLGHRSPSFRHAFTHGCLFPSARPRRGPAIHRCIQATCRPLTSTVGRSTSTPRNDPNHAPLSTTASCRRNE